MAAFSCCFVFCCGSKCTTGVFRGSKGQSYEGGVREPFIVYWKDHTPVNVSLTAMISNLDVLPTLAEWTNAPLPKGRTLDGQSVSGLLLGKGPEHPEHREIYYVNKGLCEAVRQGAWKYRETKESNSNTGILNKPQETKTELFNLSFDPSEWTNVIEDYPDIAKRLKDLFDKFPGNTEN